MEDYLAEGKPVRKIVELLGLPVPLPPKLQRADGPWANDELGGKTVLIGNAADKTSDIIKSALAASRVGRIDEISAVERYNALVFDATGIDSVDELEKLYAFFHANIRKVEKCGRAVIVAVEPTGLFNAEAAAAQQAIEGFMRSVSKEVGRKGITANLLKMPADDVDSGGLIDPAIRFLLSGRSAFISGQVVNLSASVQMPSGVPYSKPLQGKTALITGAARGIGKAIAKRMAEEGANVIVLDRQEESAEAEATAKEINGRTLLLDITAPGATDTIKEFVSRQLKGLDILVHNAGILRDKTIAKMEQQQWDQVLAVNLAAAIRINDKLLPELVHTNGRIICMASISGIGGNFGQTNYAASKAGLIGYVKSLSAQISGKGITANAIAPGFIETQMTASIPFMSREAGRRLNSLAQGGLPIDVAELAVFLASPGAAGITGQTIRVCGGNVMGA